MLTAERVIELLRLEPHIEEGGFFRQTYRSALSTAIYYLLKPGSCSSMHRLPGDEIFHFYVGDPIEMLQLPSDGAGRIVTLGTDLAAGERPQVVVAGGVWQGSQLAAGGRFALLGTTMAPGFDNDDYEHGRRDELCAAYPDFAERIVALTPAG